MSRPAATTVLTQDLLGREVYDAAGKKLGRVYDLEAGKVGNQLCVTALLVGAGSWITRFGWTPREHGNRIPWEQVENFSPHITLHPEGKD